MYLNYRNTFKYIVNIVYIQMNCDICYSLQTEFFTCSKCTNRYCTQCHMNIPYRKCPFCRHYHLTRHESKRHADFFSIIFEYIEDINDNTESCYQLCKRITDNLDIYRHPNFKKFRAFMRERILMYYETTKNINPYMDTLLLYDE